MPIDFPSSPTTGQQYTFNNIVYTFTGTTWTASANISQFTSPVLTGTPTAPTAPPTTNTQQLATTAFVTAAIAAIPPPPPQFPSGTVMIFRQTASPPTWTKQTSINDYAIRVVSGAVGSGGAIAFSTVFGKTAVDGHTLDGNELTSHAHGVADPTHAHGLGDPAHAHVLPAGESYSSDATNVAPGGSPPLCCTNGANWSTWTDSRGTGMYVGGAGTGIGIYGAGASWSHTHGMDIRTLYVDVILATKD